MVKTQEELNTIKAKVETVGEEIKELTEEELAQDNETPEIMSVSDEDLVKVSGGDDINNEKWIDIDVKDGPNNSALCPYCVGVTLSYDGRAKMFNHWVWRFHCPKCNKMFIKNVDWRRWRVRV